MSREGRTTGPGITGSNVQLWDQRKKAMGGPGLELSGVPPGHGLEAKVRRRFSRNWPGEEWEESSRKRAQSGKIPEGREDHVAKAQG